VKRYQYVSGKLVVTHESTIHSYFPGLVKQLTDFLTHPAGFEIWDEKPYPALPAPVLEDVDH
jgi:hypothetical protein